MFELDFDYGTWFFYCFCAGCCYQAWKGGVD